MPHWSQIFQRRHSHIYRESCSSTYRIQPQTAQKLHWLPVAARMQYKLCLLVHKTALGHTPDYIADLLTSVAWSSLRASRRGDLNVSRTCRRIGNRASSVAAPQAWNKLSTELKQLRSTTSFRQKLNLYHDPLPDSYLLYCVYCLEWINGPYSTNARSTLD